MCLQWLAPIMQINPAFLLPDNATISPTAQYLTVDCYVYDLGLVESTDAESQLWRLNTGGLWYSWQVLEPTPCRYRGMAVHHNFLLSRYTWSCPWRGFLKMSLPVTFYTRPSHPCAIFYPAFLCSICIFCGFVAIVYFSSTYSSWDPILWCASTFDWMPDIVYEKL